MKQLVKLLGRNTHNCLLASNTTLVNHLNGNTKRGKCSTFTNTSLQHPKFALLNGKFDIHHVSIVIFQDLKDMEQLFTSFFKRGNFYQIGNRLGITNTCNNVFTLCVNKEVTVALVGTISRITRKSNTSCRCFTFITKDHNLYINSSTKIIINLILLTINACTLIHPASKYSLLGKTKLEIWILWEGSFPIRSNLRMSLRVNVFSKDFLKCLRKIFKIFCIKFGI